MVDPTSTAEKLASLNPAARAEGARELSQQTSSQQAATVSKAKSIASRPGVRGVVAPEEIKPPSKFFGTSSEEFGEVSLTGKVIRTPEQIRAETAAAKKKAPSKREELRRPTGPLFETPFERIQKETPFTPAPPPEAPSRIRTGIEGEKAEKFGLFGEREIKIGPDLFGPEGTVTKGIERLNLAISPVVKKFIPEVERREAVTFLDMPGLEKVKEILKPIQEFTFGLKAGFVEEIRERPASLGIDLALGFGVGVAAKILPKTLVKVGGTVVGTAFVGEIAVAVGAAPTAEARGRVIGGIVPGVAAFAVGAGVGAKATTVVSEKIGRLSERLTKVELEGVVEQKGRVAEAFGETVLAETIAKSVGEAKLFKEIKFELPALKREVVIEKAPVLFEREGVTGIRFEEMPVTKLVRKPIKIRFGEKLIKDVKVEAQFVGVKEVSVGIQAELKVLGKRKPQQFIFAGRGAGVISGERGATIFELFGRQKGKDIAAITRGVRAFEAKRLGKQKLIEITKLEPIPQQIIFEKGEALIQSITKTRVSRVGKIGKLKPLETIVGDFPAILEKQLKTRGITTVGFDISRFEIARKMPSILEFRGKAPGLRIRRAEAIPKSFEEVFVRKGVAADISEVTPLKTRKEFEKIFTGFVPTEKRVSPAQLLGLGKRGELLTVPPIKVKLPPPRLKKPSRIARFEAGAFAKAIAEEAIKLTEPLKPKVRVRVTPSAVSVGARPKVAALPKILPELKPALIPELKPALKPALIPALKPALRLVPSLKTPLIPALKPALRLVPSLRPPLRPTITIVPTFMPPKVPPPFLLPFPLLREKKLKKPGQLFRPFKFAPSLVALEQKLVGPRPRVLTGIEIRRIPRI